MKKKNKKILVTDIVWQSNLSDSCFQSLKIGRYRRENNMLLLVVIRVFIFASLKIDGISF